MKPNSKVLSYRALFGSASNKQSYQLPDIYSIHVESKKITLPPSDFVISRNNQGEVISRYGQEIWNLTPYRLAGDTGSAKIIFNKLPTSKIEDAKWIMFILLFMVETGKVTGLSVSTILCYMKPIRQLAKYAEIKDVSMLKILSDEQHLISFISTVNASNILKSLMSLLGNLYAIGSKRTGIELKKGAYLENINKRFQFLKKDEQHPVIPPRIFSQIVTEVTEYIEIVYMHRHSLEGFIQQIILDEHFARGQSQQYALGYRAKDYAPFFSESAEQFGLTSLFNRFEVRNIPKLSLFLTRTFHACRLFIHIYTGMRNSEALSLKVGCLKEEIVLGHTVFQIIGETSKLVGQKKIVSWVTSKETKKAVELAEVLALIISKKIGIEYCDVPLFISTAYLELNTAYKLHNEGVNVTRTGVKSQEIFNYLDLTKFKINEEDLIQLEKIDPFRAWESDKSFRVGATWRFTTHQFRRSLAYFVAQSALVSLPSLKRQLKHISREMTVYYCQAKELPEIFNDREHISHLVRKVKPDADAIAYINDLFLTEESLWGAHGRFFDEHIKSNGNINVLTEHRNELVKRFRKGELAYKVTPLGACTTVSPCDKKVAREFVACISCDKAVIKPSKLDIVIDRQTHFVNGCKLIDQDSIEYRTELAELETLKQFKEMMIRKESLET